MITLKEERLKKRTFQPKYKTEISHRSLIQKHKAYCLYVFEAYN